MSKVPEKFITNLKWNKFVLFEWLLNEFHKNGWQSIHTGIISNDPLIIQATVKGEQGEYQGIGDANSDNVNRMIEKHKIRMAETRAIARALRWYNNIGMCSAEEMGSNDSKSKTEKDWLNDLDKDIKGWSQTILQNYDNPRDAVIALRKKFKVSKEMAKKVKDLYN